MSHHDMDPIIDEPCTCLSSKHPECIKHPNCACGCCAMDHDGREAEAPRCGGLGCHGCTGYQPAKARRFSELNDAELMDQPLNNLRVAYRELRSHHIEETTALVRKLNLARMK